MKSQESIFRLIKSLSKQEKWYFKQFAQQNALKGSSNYALLFDGIDAQDSYDEARLKKKLPDLSFAETKYQLFGNILKSLHSYHLMATVDSRLDFAIHQSEILFNKGLYPETLKVIRKAKKEALLYEKYTHLLQLLEWERQTIIYAYVFSSMKETIDDIYQKMLEYQRLLALQTDYFYLSNSLYILHFKSGVIRNKATLKAYDAIMQHPLLQDVSLAKTYEAKTVFYHCHKTYWFARQDYLKYYHYCKLHLEALEEQPHLIDAKVIRYIGALYSFGLAQVDVKEFSEFIPLLKKMRAIPEQYKTANTDINRQTIFDMSYRLELRYYNCIGDFETGKQVAKSVLKGMHQYASSLSDTSQLLFYYELSVVMFGSKQFGEALKYIQLVTESRLANVREDLVSVLKILQLIIHYELGNELLLPYIVKSVYRYLYKKKRLYKMETIILQYLRKLEKIRSRKDLIRSFSLLRDQLAALRSDPYEKIGLDYIDFIAWLDSKLHRKEYAELVRQNYLNE
ncbi:MAG: hypothetical protein U0T77_02455 [Chitinophagales bacterium]